PSLLSRSSPVVSILCKSCSELRDLHSCPTRRSSDLACRLPGHNRSRLAISLISRATWSPFWILPERQMNSASRRLNIRPCMPARDRKSTRLNSSHVKISYAVFCLKKKTHIEKTHNHH